MSADLVSVTYTSLATTRFAPEDLGDLLIGSRRANARRHVTGMLLYREGRFIQVLEGPDGEVRDLVADIRADPRHHDVRVLDDAPIDARRFADWTMGYRLWPSTRAHPPEGFRDTFDDLALLDDDAAARASRELLLWFRYRADTDDDSLD